MIHPSAPKRVVKVKRALKGKDQTSRPKACTAFDGDICLLGRSRLPDLLLPGASEIWRLQKTVCVGHGSGHLGSPKSDIDYMNGKAILGESP